MTEHALCSGSETRAPVSAHVFSLHPPFEPFPSAPSSPPPPAGELRAADAAGGLEGKNLRACGAVAMRCNLLSPAALLPLPSPPRLCYFSSLALGCLGPPSSVSVVPLGQQQWCLSVSIEEGHLCLREAKNSNNDGTTSLGYTKRKTVMWLLQEAGGSATVRL